MIEKWKRPLISLTEVGLMLVALAIVAQVLFGQAIPFLGGDVVGNLIRLIAGLGDGGYVGLIVLGALMTMFAKRQL